MIKEVTRHEEPQDSTPVDPAVTPVDPAVTPASEEAKKAEAASPVGIGVSRVRRVKRRSNKPPVIPLDADPKWSETPSIRDQLSVPGAFKVNKRYAKIFDLSKADELQAYNDLLTESSKEQPTLFVVSQKEEFCESKECWKVFVIVQSILYKVIADPDQQSISN